jgi:hypothetical protein
MRPAPGHRPYQQPAVFDSKSAEFGYNEAGQGLNPDATDS